MQEKVISQANEALIQAYLEIVATDDYKDFGTLLTNDCTFSLMPIGYTFKGRQEVMAFAETAGNRRTMMNNRKSSSGIGSPTATLSAWSTSTRSSLTRCM